MLLRFISAILVLGGLALLGLAAYSYAVPAGPALRIVDPDLEVGDVKTGEPVDVVYQLENTTSKPLRIFSLVTTCGQNCCMSLKRSDEESENFDLPPGITDIECSLRVVNPGPFKTDFYVYVEEDGVRKITLTVQGTAHAKLPPRR